MRQYRHQLLGKRLEGNSGVEMINTNGWDQLLCNFFYMICLKKLGPYFSSHGFANQKTTINGVIFRKNDLFVEISYVPETAPKYAPSVIVGIGDKKYDELGKTTGLPAWSLLPENSEERNYSLWNFSNESELEIVLNKLESKIIEKYLKPLWEDKAKLDDAIIKFNNL